MNESLEQDLRNCLVDGNVVKLPEQQLQDYPLLKKTMTKAGGKYKSNTFVFPQDAQPIIDQMLGGGSINIQKDYQAFYTPPDVASHMMDQIIWNWGFDRPVTVLEPSAGQGALLVEVESRPVNKLIIGYCEIQENNQRILKEQGYNNFLGGDFLELSTDLRFDLIIANPPFTKGADILHIRKMWDHLEEGGQLITLLSTSFLHNSQKKYLEFHAWLEEESAEYRTLGDGKFKSSGTQIDVVLLTMHK